MTGGEPPATIERLVSSVAPPASVTRSRTTIVPALVVLPCRRQGGRIVELAVAIEVPGVGQGVVLGIRGG